MKFQNFSVPLIFFQNKKRNIEIRNNKIGNKEKALVGILQESSEAYLGLC